MPCGDDGPPDNAFFLGSVNAWMLADNQLFMESIKAIRGEQCSPHFGFLVALIVGVQTLLIARNPIFRRRLFSTDEKLERARGLSAVFVKKGGGYLNAARGLATIGLDASF